MSCLPALSTVGPGSVRRCWRGHVRSFPPTAAAGCSCRWPTATRSPTASIRGWGSRRRAAIDCGWRHCQGRPDMHTAIVLGGGFALLLSCLLLGHAFGGGMPGAVTGAKLFIPLWLIGAGVNMWLGVSQAGYTAAEEFPIFLAIFGLPAGAAGVLWWALS